MVNRPAHWLALANWIHEVTGNDEVLAEDFHGPSSNRLPLRELLDLFISELTATMTVDEAYHEGQRRHIAFTPINTAERIYSDPQLAARSFFTNLKTEDGESLIVPGAPYRPVRSGWGVSGGASSCGLDTDAVLGDCCRSKNRPRPLRRRSRQMMQIQRARTKKKLKNTKKKYGEW